MPQITSFSIDKSKTNNNIWPQFHSKYSLKFKSSGIDQKYNNDVKTIYLQNTFPEMCVSLSLGFHAAKTGFLHDFLHEFRCDVNVEKFCQFDNTSGRVDLHVFILGVKSHKISFNTVGIILVNQNNLILYAYLDNLLEVFFYIFNSPHKI